MFVSLEPARAETSISICNWKQLHVVVCLHQPQQFQPERFFPEPVDVTVTFDL